MKGDRDGEDYVYTGCQKTSEALALIYSPKTNTLTLDKISTDFTFNLRSTPTNKNAKSLASQYAHLPTTGDSGAEDSPGSNSDDDENDPSTGGDVTNPYDYRHFLKRRRTSSPEPLASTPIIPASPPRRAPARQKPKPRPHRPTPAKRAPSPPPREEADADNEASDDGGLTIEMEPDTRSRRFKPAFTHDVRNGPISLRSAASSVSPAISIHEADEDEYHDEDVDVLKLEQAGEGVVLTPGEQEDEDDDEGSLEAELEHALETQADEEEGGVGLQAYGGIGALPNNELGINGFRPEAQVSAVADDSSSSSEEE